MIPFEKLPRKDKRFDDHATTHTTDLVQHSPADDVLVTSTNQDNKIDFQRIKKISSPILLKDNQLYSHSSKSFNIEFFRNTWIELTKKHPNHDTVVELYRKIILNMPNKNLEKEIKKLNINDLKTIFNVLDYMESIIQNTPELMGSNTYNIYLLISIKTKIIKQFISNKNMEEYINYSIYKILVNRDPIVLEEFIKNDFVLYKKILLYRTVSYDGSDMGLHNITDYFTEILIQESDPTMSNLNQLKTILNDFLKTERGFHSDKSYSYFSQLLQSIHLKEEKNDINIINQNCMNILNNINLLKHKYDLTKQIYISHTQAYNYLISIASQEDSGISIDDVYSILQKNIEHCDYSPKKMLDRIKNQALERSYLEGLSDKEKQEIEEVLSIQSFDFLGEEEQKEFLQDIQNYRAYPDASNKLFLQKMIKNKYKYLFDYNSISLFRYILNNTDMKEEELIHIFPHYTIPFLTHKKSYKLETHDPYFFQKICYFAFFEYEKGLIDVRNEESFMSIYNPEEIKNATVNMILSLKSSILKELNMTLDSFGDNIILNAEYEFGFNAYAIFKQPQNLFDIAMLLSELLYITKEKLNPATDEYYYNLCSHLISSTLKNFSFYNKFTTDDFDIKNNNNVQINMSPPLLPVNTLNKMAKENLTIKAQPDTKTVYVQLDSFNANNLQQELQRYDKVLDMAGNGYSVVFDVRNNPGGYADYSSQLIHKFSELKNMIILVNNGSASASEEVASILKENGNCNFVIGTQTCGKGVGFNTRSLIFGHKKFILQYTTGEYGVPVHGESGIEQKSIHIDGVTPNILIHPLSPKYLGKTRSQRVGNFYGSYLEQQMAKLQSIPDYQFYCREEDTEDFIDALSTALTTTLQQERANENPNTALTIHHDAIKKTILETAWTYEQKVQALSRQKGLELKLQSDLSSAVIPTIKASDVSVQVLLQDNSSKLSDHYKLALENHSPYPLHNVHVSLNPVFRLLLNNAQEDLNALLACSIFAGSQQKASQLTINVPSSSLTNQDQLKCLYAIIESTQLDRPVITQLWPHN
jgi:hypothetical protein